MPIDIWSKLMRIGKIAGIVGALTGAVVGAAAAWPILEPYLAAHRGYVRFIAMEATGKYQADQLESRRVVRDIQVEQADGKREQTEEAIFKWQLELAKAPDEQARQLISNRIRELQNTKAKLINQIDTLNKVRFQ